MLRLMRRPYNIRIYTQLLEKLSKALPDLALGTDLIAGFPGESEADFAATRALVEALPFAYLHVFSYSDREGTEATRLPGHVPSTVINGRSRELRSLGQAKNLEFRQRFLGRTLDLLVLETRDKGTGLRTGLSRNYIEVLFDGPDTLMGEFVPVTVTDVQPGRTFGKPLPASNQDGVATPQAGG